jgi:hypothetical protein
MTGITPPVAAAARHARRARAAARAGVAVALLAALLGGWLWGAAGRWKLDRALRASELRNDLIEARAALLGARVHLCDADVAGTRQQLEHARAIVGRASARLYTSGTIDDPLSLDLRGFGVEIDEAQRLVGRLASGAVRATSLSVPGQRPAGHIR